MCETVGIASAATVADHVVPHYGDIDLFWNGELQSLCGSCHSSAKQSEERVGYSSTIGVDGWPVDSRHHANRV